MRLAVAAVAVLLGFSTPTWAAKGKKSKGRAGKTELESVATHVGSAVSFVKNLIDEFKGGIETHFESMTAFPPGVEDPRALAGCKQARREFGIQLRDEAADAHSGIAADIPLLFLIDYACSHDGKADFGKVKLVLGENPKVASLWKLKLTSEAEGTPTEKGPVIAATVSYELTGATTNFSANQRGNRVFMINVRTGRAKEQRLPK